MIPLPLPKGKPTDRVYTALPFVPMMKTTQEEGPPPPLPFVPIEGVALTVWGWGESLMHEALNVWSLWRKSTTMLYLHGAPGQRDPYDTTDGLDLTYGDRYLGRMIKQYLPAPVRLGGPAAPVTSRSNYMPPADRVWSREAAPDNEHITLRGEQAMTTEPTLSPDDMKADASREYLARWADQQCTNPPPEYTNEDGSIDWPTLVVDRGQGVPRVTITDGSTNGVNVPNPESVTLPYVVPNLYTSPVEQPSAEGPAPLTTYLEYLSTIKVVYTTLVANGTHKQAGIALSVLSANWLGDMLYHMVPFSGVPMAVGMLCLSSLLLRSNREKLVRVLKEHVE